MRSKSSMKILALNIGGANPTEKTCMHAIDEIIFFRMGNNW